MNEVYIPGIGNKPGVPGGPSPNSANAGFTFSIPINSQSAAPSNLGTATTLSASQTVDPAEPFTHITLMNNSATSGFYVQIGTNGGLIYCPPAISQTTIIQFDVLFFQIIVTFTADFQTVIALRTAPNQR